VSGHRAVESGIFDSALPIRPSTREVREKVGIYVAISIVIVVVCGKECRF
jgi:hypothetical protein